MATPLLPTELLDIVQMDRPGILARLQTLANQADSRWSDFSLNHPENIILEAQALLFSAVGDLLNERARQLSLATVTERLAAIRLTRLYGFQLTGASAAQVDGTFYLPNSATATSEVTLPAGLRVQAGDTYYTLYTASTIAVGSNASATVTLENSEEATESFQSDEVANIVLQLTNTPHIDGTLTVTAGNGTYTSVDATGRTYKSFMEMDPDTLGYISMMDNNGRVYILFGNGVNGAIPIGTITVTHRIGGGEEGRVESNYSGWRVLDTVYDAGGNPVTVYFQNPAASVGGYDSMTVEEARVEAPLALRTIERCVNEEDFEWAAQQVTGICRAAMITSNQDSRIPEDVGRLYAVAYGTAYEDTGYYPPASPTTSQLTEISDSYESGGSYPALMGFSIEVYAAVFWDITVDVRIYKEASYDAASVKTSITQALQKFFAVADDSRGLNTQINFGYKLLGADGTSDFKISWSMVLNAINDAPGVREIDYGIEGLLLNGSRQSVILEPHQFPRLSTITVRDMDDGGVQI